MRSSSHSQPKGCRGNFQAIRDELSEIKFSETTRGQMTTRNLATALRQILQDQRDLPTPKSPADKKCKADDGENQDIGAKMAHGQDQADSSIMDAPGSDRQPVVLSESQRARPAPADPTVKAAQAVHTGRVDRIERASRLGRDVNTHSGNFNLIAELSRVILILARLGTFLDPIDILNLYSVSRDFHSVVNASLASCIREWTRINDPETAAIVLQSGYRGLFIPDPAGRLLSEFVPEAPQDAMVMARGRMVREIVSHLARAGLRTPRDTASTLLKVWTLMDVPTTQGRVLATRDRRFMTDMDLVKAHIFFVKLALLFSDPFYGTDKCELLELFLGQRGLGPLWQMLMGHKYRTTAELLQLKVRHDFVPNMYLYREQSILGVPAAQIGKGFHENRGKGAAHLVRPTELIARELIRRDLNLESHIFHLMLWGHVHQTSGRNLAPSEDEIYMRDTDYANRSIDNSCEYQPLHCRKERWDQLSIPERRQVLRDEERIEAYISRRDSSTLGDYAGFDANVDYGGPGEGIHPYCDSDSDDEKVAADGKPNARPKTRRLISSWEASVIAQLQCIESGAGSGESGQDMEGDQESEATDSDQGTAMARLALQSEGMPEYAMGQPQRAGRYRFPPAFDFDDPFRGTPFVGVGPPVEEAPFEMFAWDAYEDHFDTYFTADADDEELEIS
ncbi:hypothetical protein HD806DRAFT_544660 [Xylariaceae sp. AK1471]|nr:hypothetical protein HD806DRAFT_544660 [Xylariaceae sp. AK1471]